jgi:hypothetical protein
MHFQDQRGPADLGGEESQSAAPGSAPLTPAEVTQLLALRDRIALEVASRARTLRGALAARVLPSAPCSFWLLTEDTCSACGAVSPLAVSQDRLNLHFSLTEFAGAVGSSSPRASPVTIARLLRGYFGNESIEKTCEGGCARGDPPRMRSHTRQLRFITAPRVLYLTIKRYEFDKTSGRDARLDTPVSVEEELALEEACFAPLAGLADVTVDPSCGLGTELGARSRWDLRRARGVCVYDVDHVGELVQ